MPASPAMNDAPELTTGAAAPVAVGVNGSTCLPPSDVHREPPPPGEVVDGDGRGQQSMSGDEPADVDRSATKRPRHDPAPLTFPRRTALR